MARVLKDTRPFARFEWMLAMRYLRSKRREGFISVISIFSFLGSFLRYWIGGSIASAIVGPFFAVALTLVYYALVEQPAAGTDTVPVSSE